MFEDNNNFVIYVLFGNPVHHHISAILSDLVFMLAQPRCGSILSSSRIWLIFVFCLRLIIFMKADMWDEAKYFQFDLYLYFWNLYYFDNPSRPAFDQASIQGSPKSGIGRIRKQIVNWKCYFIMVLFRRSSFIAKNVHRSHKNKIMFPRS